jgi:chorismate dehydratase
VVADLPEGPLRIGAVAYLNSRPLIYGLARQAPAVQLSVDFPSRLADSLAQGRLDVAIIPSIEYLRQPGSTIVSDACIACDGPVRSVKLFSRVPLGQIRSLALDEGSRTSVALARILLAERFGLTPELESLPLGRRLADAAADAAVLIGDRAMREPGHDFPHVCDLGEAWVAWTGLPLVFALWVARPGAPAAPLARLLSAARDAGLCHLDEIAREAAPEIGLPEADCLAYLRDHLRFHLGHRQRLGLRRFFELAVRHGQAPAVRDLS